MTDAHPLLPVGTGERLYLLPAPSNKSRVREPYSYSIYACFEINFEAGLVSTYESIPVRNLSVRGLGRAILVNFKSHLSATAGRRNG